MPSLKSDLTELFNEVQTYFSNRIEGLSSEQRNNSHTQGYINIANERMAAFKDGIEKTINLHSNNPFMYNDIMTGQKQSANAVKVAIDEIK